MKLQKQEIKNQTQQTQNAQLVQQAQLSMLQQQDFLMVEIFQKFYWQWYQKLNYSSTIDKKQDLCFLIIYVYQL